MGTLNSGGMTQREKAYSLGRLMMAASLDRALDAVCSGAALAVFRRSREAPQLLLKDADVTMETDGRVQTGRADIYIVARPTTF